MKRWTRWLSTPLLAALLAPSVARAEGGGAAATPGYPEPVVQWGVQKDETCEDVAKAVYGSAKHASLALRYNRVDCTRGKKLKEGTTLVLPASVTSLPSARLRSLNPDVKARPPGGSWGPAAAGQPLTSNAGVNTLATGRADIEFIDRTRVFLAANTLVIIHGSASQSAVSRTAPPAVEVQAGEVKAGLAALRGETVEIAVQGGGRVSAASRETLVERKGDRTTASVYDGSAKVTSGGASVSVPLNHGTRFVGAAAPSAPRPLPPAPAWESATSQLVIASAEGGQIRAAWGDVKDAKSYRVEIARDEGFRDLVAREEVTSDVRTFRAEKMPLGRYFVAVRAIDKEEYLGVAAKRTVDVVKMDAGLGIAPSDKEITANPYGVLALATGSKVDLAIDDGPFGPMPAELDLAKRAPSRVRIRPYGSDAAHELSIRYTEVGATVTATLASDAKTAAVEVTFRGLDAIDIPSRVGPVLRFGAGPAAAQVALARKDGRWIATVPAPAPGASLRVDVLDARGAILGTGSVAPPKPAEAPVKQAPTTDPKVPEIGVTTEVWQPSPITGVAFWSPTARNAASAAVATQVGSAGAGFRFQGLATGAFDRFGVDALLRSPVVGEVTGADASHDEGAWLGGRARVFRIGNAEIEGGVSMRVGFPVSSVGPSPRLEPSVALGGVLGSWSYLVNFGARVRLAEGGSEVPLGQGFLLAGGTLTALDWLRFGATIDAHLLGYATQDALFRGGLSLHAEAGTWLFGALSARISPWDDDGSGFRDGELSAQLALGLRAP